MKISTLASALCKAPVGLLAIYGAYCFSLGGDSPSLPPPYSAHFAAGIQDVGPGETVGLGRLIELAALASEHSSSAWKMYVFPDAPLQEPSTFLDVVSADDYPLVRFRFVKITVDCRRGPVPDSFKVSPEPTTIAVR